MGACVAWAGARATLAGVQKAACVSLGGFRTLSRVALSLSLSLSQQSQTPRRTRTGVALPESSERDMDLPRVNAYPVF